MNARGKILRNILITALFLHICLLLVLRFLIEPRIHLFYNDGQSYSAHGRIISYLLLDKLPDKNIKIKYPDLKSPSGDVLDYAQKRLLIPPKEYQVGYITYFYSLIYAAFGYRPIIINLMNILLNLFTGVIIFMITRMIFNKKAGYIAMTIFLFNPTLFYYSTTKLAESIYISIAYVFIYSILILSKRKIFYLLPIIAAIFLIKLFKEIYFYAFVSIFVTYLIYLLIRYLLRNKKFVILVLGIIPLLLLFLYKINLICQRIIHILKIAAYHNQKYEVSGGLTYNLLIFGKEYKDYNLMQWLGYIINAWYHMIFEPLYPNTINYLLYYCFKIIFLFLFLFALLQIRNSFVNKKNPIILLLIFFIILGSIIATGSGNVGTILRHRDIITPIVFIFSAIFLTRYLKFLEKEEVRE